MKNLVEKVLENKNKLVGIRINDSYYDVDCVIADSNELEVIKAYTIDNDCIIRYDFTAFDIENSNVKLYRLEEV